MNRPEGYTLARKKSLAVSAARMAIFRPTPGFKGITFKLCVLIRWDLNSRVRSSSMWGQNCIPFLLGQRQPGNPLSRLCNWVRLCQPIELRFLFILNIRIIAWTRPIQNYFQFFPHWVSFSLNSPLCHRKLVTSCQWWFPSRPPCWVPVSFRFV